MKDLFYSPVIETGKNHEILFWGCLHYRHDPKWDIPLWKMRGFESSREHDMAILTRWNERASEKTVGFLLGDTIFGYGAAEAMTILFETMQFRKLYVMPGNHQAGWKQMFEACDGHTYTTSHGGVVEFVPNYLEAYVNGQPIVMSHYPVLSWNGQGKGSWMLFAHVHGSLSKSELGRMYLSKGYNMEVSVENASSPITFGEIKVRMDGREKFSPDHHDGSAAAPFSR